MAYVGKFIDRSPDLRPAGVTSKRMEEGKVADCLVHEVTEDEAKEFICKTGTLEYNLPPLRTNVYKGIYTDVRECVQPEADRGFYEVLTREFQDTVYDSYWNKPLGRVADPTPMLPQGMNPKEVCFGEPTPKYTSAREVVNPPKSYLDVMEESEVGHDMYKHTHNDYHPGEQVRRNYVEPFKPDLIWGMHTPSDPFGGCIKKIMSCDVGEKIQVSKVLADHMTRNKPLLGKVWAPNNNEQCVPEGHAFGKLNRRELYGVGELLKDCPASLDKLDLFDEFSHMNTLRTQIVKRHQPSSQRDLNDAFHKIDLDNTGCLPLDKAFVVLGDFYIFPDKNIFENFLRRLKILNEDGIVAYEKMVDLLNVNEVFPDINKIQDVPSEFLKFETTNQIAHKYHCSDAYLYTTDTPRAGDAPRPHVSVAGLVSPNVFSNYGLEPRDFFVCRTQNYVRKLFDAVGCTLSDDCFGEIWNAAKDKKGCVCVASFLNMLKKCK